MNQSQTSLNEAQVEFSPVLQNIVKRLRQENERFRQVGTGLVSCFNKLSVPSQTEIDPQSPSQTAKDSAKPTIIDCLWNELEVMSFNNSQLEKLSNEFRNVIG